MVENLFFKPVKDDGIKKETFIEHAIRTYRVGEFLFDELKLETDKNRFLYACFFHDVGKLLIGVGKGVHTPKSKDALEMIKKSPEYPILLKNFELNDFSEDKDVLNAIEKHHDSNTQLGAFVSIADQIASSSNNEDLKNRLKETPISSLITYLNEMHGFDKYNFYFIVLPSFSKNEFNAIGKLLLLKLLYETIAELRDVKLLYETLDGCRVVTKQSKDKIISLLSEQFNANFVEFFKHQSIKELIRGAPDGFKQYTTFPKEIKPELLKLTVQKYTQDILNALKKKKIDKLEDIGITEEILLRFAELPELRNYYSNIKGTKYHLLADREGKFSRWIAQTFNIRGKQVEGNIVEYNKPIIEELLENARADISKITNKDILYSKLFPLVMAVNSLSVSDTEFTFDVSKFLAIDGNISLNEISKENVCANCGTFEGKIPLETFTFGHRQHFRESLFRERNDSIRNGKILVCMLCHAEALLNTVLCGIAIENQRARVNTKTHLVLYGLDIDRDVINNLADKKLVERLLRDFKITKKTVYVKDKKDLQILLLSLEEFNVGIKNDLYKQLLFSLITTKLKEQNPLLLAFSVNTLPRFLDSSFLQFSERSLDILNGSKLDFFEYVYVYVNAKYDQKRDYILQYCNKPLRGIAQILKRESTIYGEETEKVVRQLIEEDRLYGIMDEIWEMARLSGALETGKNVGSFLGVFRGKPEDLDRIANKFMKNEKLSAEQRAKIIEIHQRLREELRTIDDKTRKELKDYAQKTKYLFNSKKFYEIKKGGR